MFTSNNHRRDSKIVERYFRATLDVLQESHVRRALGAKAAELEMLATQVFTPRVDRGGKISIPPEYKETDYIPVLPATGNQQFSLDASFIHLTPRQRMQAAKRVAGYPMPPEEILDSIENGFDDDIALSVIAPKSRASVAWRVIGSQGNEILKAYEGPSRLYSVMRPVMFLGRRALATPSVVVHELIHIGQVLEHGIANRDNPVFSEEVSADWELEAYHWGAMIEQYENDDSLQQRIEAARQELADPRRPFRATPDLIERVKEIGVNLSKS